MTALTKTKLHALGYRRSKDGESYWKSRRVCARPEHRAVVRVMLRENGWYDVTSTEAGSIESSILLRGVRQLKQWEAFAFCL